ncbi:uncharacterized protein BDCG_04857 [Blastomyces dermatitidis ER-3]|uniref:Uncharacterized protein n=1 Tax=Ajellomyces dermatitidis (strain ER-3 / ATCC MYA-2586) TaxID=559297 RepID=A0ABP2EZK8_AJEDR|nr:uncharacterized protein BDCG_04857 [Blastomyces dermatitidis ER-3]EEQ89737.2 hypothetical protein BDCG_04857 [Blastomyces dermatitidis ER-3]
MLSSRLLDAVYAAYRVRVTFRKVKSLAHHTLQCSAKQAFESVAGFSSSGEVLKNTPKSNDPISPAAESEIGASALPSVEDIHAWLLLRQHIHILPQIIKDVSAATRVKYHIFVLVISGVRVAAECRPFYFGQ